MKSREEKLFYQLKKEVSAIFLQDFPSSNPDISQWKGLDIIYFQEHLRQKVRGNVSEKWFYSYFKSPYEKLPRIDMLNLLTQYCGYRRGWTEFIEIQNDKISNKEINGSNNNILDVQEVIKPEAAVQKESTLQEEQPKKPIKIIAISIISVFILIFGFIGFKYFENKNTYEFCFYDADRGSVISSALRITINKNGVSPEYYRIQNGCFQYKSTMDTLKMTVESPIYKKELFVVDLKSIREHGENNHKSFVLRPDDYAIMLYYYSTTLNSSDEKQKALLINQRKEELSKLIADHALIYQVYDSKDFGVEVLDKKRYIDFMTTPTTSLKNYVLIESKTNKNNKISLIKFKIQEDEN